MSFNPEQFRELVVRITLEYLDPEIPYSKEAEDLLLMTAAHESRLGTYLKQVNGWALGAYQIEPETHQDIWTNYLQYNKELQDKCIDLRTNEHGRGLDGHHPLFLNLMYATAMARVHYWRVPEPLPKETDEAYLYSLASYAKQHYNTHLGKAKATDYYRAYLEFYKE